MKRTLSVLLVLAMLLVSVLAMIPVSAATVEEIETAEDFAKMDPTKDYKLIADIELDKTYAGGEFTGDFDGNGHTITLGGEALGVFGNFNGGKVKNLTIEGDIMAAQSTDVGALFRWGWGTFENITNDTTITLQFDAKVGQLKVGGIAGLVKKKSTFKNCVNNGDITIDSNGEQQEHYVGGIMGQATGNGDNAKGQLIKMEDCTNTGNIVSDAAGAYLGGMAGHVANMRFEAYSCVNGVDTQRTRGALTATQSAALANKDNSYTGVGGMVGGTHQGGGNDGLSIVMSQCINYGPLTAVEAEGIPSSCFYIGGMLGRGLHNNVFRTSNCKNFGNITVPESDQGWSGAGGMAGCFMTVGMSWAGTNVAGTTIMEGCTNEGAIAGKKAGGLWGSVYQMYHYDHKVVLQYCENKGNITAKEEAGGMIGLLNDSDSVASDLTIQNCKNTGAITSKNIAAGIVGRISQLGGKSIPSINNCVNTGTITTTGAGATVGTAVAAGILGVMPTGQTMYVDDTWNKKLDGTNTYVVNKPDTTTQIEIKDCVVTGALVKADTPESNRFAITYSGYTLTDSSTGNLFKTGIAPADGKFGGTESAESACNTKIGTIKTTVIDVSALDAKVKDAKAERIEGDYQETAWAAYEAAITAADAFLADYFDATEQDVTDQVNALDAALTTLENSLKPVDNDKKTLQDKVTEGEGKLADEAKYTGLSVNRLKEALDAAKTVIASGDRISQFTAALTELTDAIEGLKEKPVQGEDPGTQGGTTPGGDSTQAAGDATDPAGDATGAAGDEEEGGCGSAIAATAVVLSTVIALGAGVAFKKRED